MFSKKLAILTVLVMIAPIILAACGPTPEPVVIKETSVVVETVVVEKEGETVVQEVTAIVEVEKEVVVTATPVPEPTTPPKVELEGLWYPIGTEPPTLDIQDATDTTSHLILKQTIEGLFEYMGDGSIQPTGATGYTISDDGLVITVSLRDDAVWSDGVPVVAQQFVDGVIRLLDPELASDYAWLMYDVEGAEAYNTGETDDPTTVGVKALDDYTFEITLAAPTPYFETVLPFSTFDPVRLDLIEAHPDDWTEPGNFLSNGPYLLESWDHEAELVLVKNPTYHDADKVTIEKVTIPIITEDATSLALYENDELHTTGQANYPNEDMPRILEDPVLSAELRVLPRPGVYYVGLNTLRAPTDDVNVRKALAAAVDRQTIIDNVLNTPWRTPLSCTTPPKILGYQEYGTCGHAFDIDAAKQFLADAGYPDGEGFPVLSVWFNRGNEDILEAVAAMWEENLGINVELRTNEWAVYLDYLDACRADDVAACEYNAYRMGWVMDYGDPQNQLQVVFAPSSPFQYTGWASERFDELMDLAGTEFDTAKREAYYKEADKILCEDEAAIIPIMGYENNTLIKEGVTFDIPPFGSPAFIHWALP
jgi:oligopeptide transport system substrate-binding protein